MNWQHIDLQGKWNFLLLSFLEFNDLKYYAMTRNVFTALVDKGVIKQQYNGYWFSRDSLKQSRMSTNVITALKPLTRVHSADDLDELWYLSTRLA